MDFEIIEMFNDSTMLVNIDNNKRVVKEINRADIPVYNKLKKIKNDNLIQIYDVLEENEKVFVIQEYVEGKTIEQYMEQSGKFSTAIVKDICTCICDGLDALHKAGIVHRDISANNIVINENTVKIIDFGISRTVKLNKGRDTALLGTQGYAAPEQFGFKQSSARTDIYSLGVLMNYMLTGKFPYEELAYCELTPIIRKCISIDESKRYQTVTQLKNAVKKRRFRSIIYDIPGFRTNKLYKKIIATAYYLLVAFLYLAYFCYNQGLWDFISACIIYFFMFIMPVPILFNYKNWSDKLFKYKSDRQRLVFRMILSFLCVFSTILIVTFIYD